MTIILAVLLSVTLYIIALISTRYLDIDNGITDWFMIILFGLLPLTFESIRTNLKVAVLVVISTLIIIILITLPIIAKFFQDGL